ncbi:hypothetical protein ACVW0R_002041 [Thermostichus sp. MS-CIW-15]
MMKYGCQQVRVRDRELVPLLEYLCQQSNKVYNCALYYARQVYFKTKRWASYGALCAEMGRTQSKHFIAMYVSAAQQTCKSVAGVGLCQACPAQITGSEKSSSN